MATQPKQQELTAQDDKPKLQEENPDNLDVASAEEEE